MEPPAALHGGEAGGAKPGAEACTRRVAEAGGSVCGPPVLDLVTQLLLRPLHGTCPQDPLFSFLLLQGWDYGASGGNAGVMGSPTLRARGAVSRQHDSGISCGWRCGAHGCLLAAGTQGGCRIEVGGSPICLQGVSLPKAGTFLQRELQCILCLFI